MHTPGKGMSSSALPYKRTPPSWLKTTSVEVRAAAAALRRRAAAGWGCVAPALQPAERRRARPRGRNPTGPSPLRAHARLPAAAAPLTAPRAAACRPATPQVEELICKFSKKGLTPSQIGVLLRDNHGIAQVSTVTGSKVLRILKGAGA
jgi:hypothetical protein